MEKFIYTYDIYLQCPRFLANENRAHKNFIHFVRSRKCSSRVGNLFKSFESNGRQTIKMRFADSSGISSGSSATRACDRDDGYAYGTVIHEISHALGTYFVRQIINSIGRRKASITII